MTTAWPANRVRDTFVSFFAEKCGHVNYKSSPVVPHDDPTLLCVLPSPCLYPPSPPFLLLPCLTPHPICCLIPLSGLQTLA